MSKQKKNCLKVFGIASGLGFGFFLAHSLFAVLRSSFKVSIPVSACVALSVVALLALLVFLHRPSRCIFFLMIPQFFSRRGRKLFIAYAYFLALTGPTNNMMENLDRMTNGIICGEVRKFLKSFKVEL